MSNEAAKNARKSLEDLKRQLQTAQPVFVDSQGRLTTPEEERQKNEDDGETTKTGYMKVKPSRWF
ncbi:MAG: hypothetical protein J0I20_16915 [Chloroflexi bacterium]|nr:hypothetical protein [Chloroflexota bacterium]OJV88130.1 MAG: hypothetical protein BGO39_07975 [Chloroflexi bacterium 54-19]